MNMNNDYFKNEFQKKLIFELYSYFEENYELLDKISYYFYTI